MLDRLFSMLIAVTLALLVWLYARSRDQEILDNVPIPVTITLASAQAEQFAMEVTGPQQVLVSFTGPPQRIRELRGVLQRNELQVNMTAGVPHERETEPRIADTVVVVASDIPAPPGVKPMVVEGRNRIPVLFQRIVERRLPVRFEHGTEDATAQVIIEPATVTVRGPQELLDRAKFIGTEAAPLPVRPAGAPSTAPASARIGVEQALEGRPVTVWPNRVSVKVYSQPQKRYDLVDVPIHFLCPPNFQLRPQFIDERAGRFTLKLLGPIKDEPPKVYAFLDLTKGRFSSGLNHEPLQLQLPKDFTLVQEPPRVIAFELVPADFVPRGLNPLPTP
jgi:hypothetical protein